MKKLLIMESVSAGLLLLLVVVIIQMSSCGKKEKMQEMEDEEKQIHVSKDLWIYAGKLSGGISPLTDREEAEERLWGLCFSNIFLDTESAENPKAKEKTHPFFYHVQKEGKKTYITIGICTPIKNVSGSEITADDLLFNFYLRCDPSSALNRDFAFGIEGGKEYYYGTKKIKKRKEKVKKILQNPGEKLKKRIRTEIILPELYKEYEWVEELFSGSEFQKERKGYQSAEEFFSHFYAYRTSYQPEKKEKEKILSDIADQYGANYQALEKVTGKSYEAKAESFVLSELFEKEKEDHVERIKGIQKLDPHTIQIVLQGQELDPGEYLDFWLLPLENYGEESGFWKKETSVWKKGGAAYVCEKAEKEYKGSGSFYCFSIGKETICLRKNPYTASKKNRIREIFMSCSQNYSAAELVKSMLERKIDLAVYPVDGESEKLRRDRGTGAISSLACLKTKEDEEVCIIYRAEYINATTFPVERGSLRQIFYEMGSLELNE